MPNENFDFLGELERRKMRCFEYLIDKFAERNNDDVSSFSTLKILKLLFFVSAVSYDPEQETSLLDIFNDFVVMPYGPVENFVYNNLDSLPKYSITSSECTVMNDTIDTSVNLGIGAKEMIDKAVDLLLTKNPDILKHTAYNLVDISHEWSCWKICFDLAKKHDKLCMRLPKQMIENSVKYYR